MVCPICGTELENLSKCVHCGFEDVRTDFVSSEEKDHWMQMVVRPYAFEYVFKTVTPSEERIIKKRFGLFDGKLYTREELAKERNVCVNRIMQIEAKAFRKMKRLWYFQNTLFSETK